MHHHHENHHDRHHLHHLKMARRHMHSSGFGFNPEGGPGGFGSEFRLRRMLRGDDLRLVVLLLLSDAPRHGYDLIKAIEEKTAEAYSPSPGVIYPALTFLEEAGYATTEMDGVKKVYAITDTGRAHLEENRAEADTILEGLIMVGKRAAEMREHLAERHGRGKRGDRDIPGVLPEVNQARRALKAAISAASDGDEATQKRLAEILTRAAEDIGKLEVDI